MTTITLVLEKQDRNTILAALRFYQENGQGDPFNRSDMIHDIATDGDETSLDADGIDDLCERINTSGEPDLLSAMQWLLDEMEAAGEVHGADGKPFSVCQNAGKALIAAGGDAHWYDPANDHLIEGEV